MKGRSRSRGTKAAALMLVALMISFAFSACVDKRAQDGPLRTDEAATTAAATGAAVETVSATPAAATPPAVTSPAAASVAAVEQKATGASVDKAGDAPANSGKKSDKEKSSESEKENAPPEKPDKGDTKKDNKAKPDNKPKPKPANEKITVTISIDCLTLLASDPDMAGQVSDEGVILAEKGVEVASGANVYEVLRASGVSFVGEAYISSISGLSEGDGGARSGWMYSVNGVFPTVGVTKYAVGSGDHVRFRYTLDGGADVR